MRLSDIISLGSSYLILGIIFTLSIVGVFLIGYHVIYKKVLKGTEKVKAGTVFIYAIFICYVFVVLGATLLSRGSMWQSNIEYHLFYSYREAWNGFSANVWRYIILNILMFVPFGLLLPIVSKHFQKCWKTYLAGLGFSFLIEMIQYIFKKGICEIDDLFNNMLGAMIGYGLFSILFYIVARVKKKEYKTLAVVLCQLPLLAVTVAFTTIFTIYGGQELGNLNGDYIYTRSNIEVSSKIEFNSDEISMPVYQLYVASKEETKEQAAELFKIFGTEVDESRIDIYDNTAIYYSTTEGKCVWIEYAGSTSRYTDFDEMYREDGEVAIGLENVDESEIRKALESLNVVIPKDAIFEESEDDNYEFVVNQVLSDGKLYNGNITCTYNTNNKISGFTNNIIEYSAYKNMPIRSEQEAYDRLAEGKFRYYGTEKLNIVIEDISIEYQIDSKGYYQPVYEFEGTINGKEGYISVSAIK